MTTLVVGATGATGQLLVDQLLQKGEEVRVIVRSAERLPAAVASDPNLTVTEASLLQLSDEEMARQVAGCNAVASCLGHNLTLRGIFGPPHRLVTDATRRLCRAIRASQSDATVKFVLMNTAGNRNRDLQEPVSTAQRLLVGLLRLLMPPQADNEQAAEFLRTQIGQNDPLIQWVVVRPDTLIDEAEVSGYDIHPSPTRSAVFNPGKTSRIQVAHFMAELITDASTWRAWKGQMPVLYNKVQSGSAQFSELK